MSFPKRTSNILDVSTPIRDEHAAFNIAMKTAMRPVGYTGYVSVLHGIEMNVIDMPFEVRFVAYGVLPIAALPNAFFSLGKLAFRPCPRVDTARKTTLDQAPARGEISIAFRKYPDRMDMIGQDTDGDGFERSTFLNEAISLPQAVNLVHKKVARSIRENDRKEECAAVDLRSSVLRHDAIISRPRTVGCAKTLLRRNQQSRCTKMVGTLRFAHPTKG
jgi:hypothetical protein